MLLIAFATILVLSASAQPYQAGTIYYGAHNYIEYRAGNLPIIITAPHGGHLTPVSIPDRNCTGCVYVADANTDDLAAKIDEAIRTSMGGYPHIIINHLHRIKLDANREIVEAANGNSEAEAAWHEWESFVLAAKADIVLKWGKGLMIDLHGHGHTLQRLELGFNLSDAELRLSDATLASTTYRDKTAIKYNIIHNLTGYNTPEMIRGDFALGTLLAARGYPSVPSQQDVAPLASDPYFEGGYNIQRYGSNDGTTIDAIQIECNFTGVRNSSANRTAFATQTADALKIYLLKHYFATLPVSLVTFRGQHIGGINRLVWQTETETNNKGFQIERSPQPPKGAFPTWETIGTVNAKGKAATYEFTDKAPFGGWGLYRLRQIDNDGKETLSKVISIASKDKGKLAVYPNPVTSVLTIETELIGSFQIINLLGQQVLTGKTPSEGRGLDVSALPQGTYFLKVGTEQVKFIKQ